MEAVPVVPLSPLPDDPVEVPETIQSRPARTLTCARRSRSSSSSASGTDLVLAAPRQELLGPALRLDRLARQDVQHAHGRLRRRSLRHQRRWPTRSPGRSTIRSRAATASRRWPRWSPRSSPRRPGSTLAEWDEKPSTNDLIFTPAGGAVIGEATYRLGRMFAAGSPSMGNCLGALLFSPIATLNETRVCRTGRQQPTDDVRVARAHLALSGVQPRPGLLLVRRRAARHRARPGFRRRDRRPSRLPAAGNGAQRRLTRRVDASSPGRTSSPTAGSVASELHAGGVWWGRYYRNYAAADETAPRETDGWGLMLGLGSTFDFDSRVLPLEWDRVVTAGPGRADARVFQPARRPHHPGDARPPSTASRW